MDMLSAVQTRSGLKYVKRQWLAAIAENPWTDYHHVREKLWNENAISFPIFALKYEWSGQGMNKYYNKKYYPNCLEIRISDDFKYASPFSITDIENAVKSFTPHGMIDMLYLEAAALDATPLHDQFYTPNPEMEEDKKPNQFTKWVVEKSLFNAPNLNVPNKGNFCIEKVAVYATFSCSF